jgi:fructokinase
VTKDGKTYENPETVFQEIVHFIKANEPEEGGYSFIGIASFGPLCLDESSPKYGSITTTPKKLWQNIELLKIFQERLNNNHIKIDTDVNSCAFAEFKLGNHHAKNSLVYITVGTGVGVGVVVHGKTVHGLTHPEGGHIM